MFDGQQSWPRTVKLVGGNGPTKPVRRQFSLVSFRVSGKKGKQGKTGKTPAATHPVLKTLIPVWRK